MNSSNIIAVSAKMYRGKAQQDRDPRKMAALSMMNNKQKDLLEEMPCDYRSKEREAIICIKYLEKENLRQRNNRTKTLRQTILWITGKSWPMYLKENKR